MGKSCSKRLNDVSIRPNLFSLIKEKTFQPGCGFEDIKYYWYLKLHVKLSIILVVLIIKKVHAATSVIARRALAQKTIVDGVTILKFV